MSKLNEPTETLRVSLVPIPYPGTANGSLGSGVPAKGANVTFVTQTKVLGVDCEQGTRIQSISFSVAGMQNGNSSAPLAFMNGTVFPSGDYVFWIVGDPSGGIRQPAHEINCVIFTLEPGLISNFQISQMLICQTRAFGYTPSHIYELCNQSYTPSNPFHRKTREDIRVLAAKVDAIAQAPLPAPPQPQADTSQLNIKLDQILGSLDKLSAHFASLATKQAASPTPLPVPGFTTTPGSSIIPLVGQVPTITAPLTPTIPATPRSQSTAFATQSNLVATQSNLFTTPSAGAGLSLSILDSKLEKVLNGVTTLITNSTTLVANGLSTQNHDYQVEENFGTVLKDVPDFNEDILDKLNKIHTALVNALQTDAALLNKVSEFQNVVTEKLTELHSEGQKALSDKLMLLADTTSQKLDAALQKVSAHIDKNTIEIFASNKFILEKVSECAVREASTVHQANTTIDKSVLDKLTEYVDYGYTALQLVIEKQESVLDKLASGNLGVVGVAGIKSVFEELDKRLQEEMESLKEELKEKLDGIEAKVCDPKSNSKVVLLEDFEKLKSEKVECYKRLVLAEEFILKLRARQG